MNNYLARNPRSLGPLQRAWLKALRSGEFTQCRSVLATGAHLRTANKYCCLGVACVVATDEGAVDAFVVDASFTRGDGWIVDEIKDAFQFRGDQGEPTEPLGANWSCTEMNDAKKMTFEEIADHVEANAAAYFYEAR